jgi:uncharacterized protein involved in exopolysaccharide biosynthesis
MSTQSNWSLREFYTILFRYKQRAILLFAAVMALATIAIIVCPSTYTSEAKLFVRVGRESVTLDPTATTGSVMGMNMSREAEINSILEVMRSSSLTGKVLDTIDSEFVHASPELRERKLKSLSRRLSISSPRLSNVIEISCKAESADRAQKIVSVFVDVFLDEHLRINSTPGSFDFFNEQCSTLKQKLDAATGELRDTKSKFGLASIDGRRQAVQGQINLVQKQVLETKHALRTREQEILAVVTEQHPDAIAIRRQINEVERIFSSDPRNHQHVTAAVAAANPGAESLVAHSQSLAQQKARLEDQLRTLNDQEVLITDLQRKIRVLEREYDTAADKLAQARVGQALDTDEISNINVIQPATFAPKRTSPKIRLYLGIAFILATCSALGITLISDLMDHSMRTPEDVEKKLGLPTLVSIPRMHHQQLPH